MIIKSLTGYSGCKVLLCEDKDRKFVRKISSNHSYNVRLLNQMTKQINFHKKDCLLKSPKVIESGYTGDLFYFDMEYINGVLMSDYMCSVGIADLNPYFHIILEYLTNSDALTFKDLTHSIESKVEKIRKETSKYKKYLDCILEEDWRALPVSSCHGDLTLENLIVSNGNLYFIDFLDSFEETRLLDFSKLLFDLRYFWSKRHAKTKNIVKNIYANNLVTDCDMYSNYSSAINKLIILDIIRILPYCKDSLILDHLEECLDHAAKQIV